MKNQLINWLFSFYYTLCFGTHDCGRRIGMQWNYLVIIDKIGRLSICSKACNVNNFMQYNCSLRLRRYFWSCKNVVYQVKKTHSRACGCMNVKKEKVVLEQLNAGFISRRIFHVLKNYSKQLFCHLRFFVFCFFFMVAQSL